VVEAGLAYQSVERVEWTLWIRLVQNEWVKEWTLLRTTQCKRGPLVVWTDTSGETSVGVRLTRLSH
jgi:hypothetical protein